MNSRSLALLSAALLAACSSSDPTEPIAPNPPPAIFLTATVGDGRLEGELVLRPEPGSAGWTYSVTFPPDGPRHEGVIEGEVRFPFVIEEPGLHRFFVHLASPDGEQDARRVLSTFVNDGGPVRHEVVLDLPQLWDLSYEGLAIDPAGRFLYAANYSRGDLYRIDLEDPHARPRLVETSWSIEGLSVSPSGVYLFAAYKRHSVARFRLPDLEPAPFLDHLDGAASFYITALDDRRALSSGGGSLSVLDLETRAVEAVAPSDVPWGFRAWHHDLSPAGDLVAAVDATDWSSVHLFRLPDLEPAVSFELDGAGPELVAFDPTGNVIYVVGCPGGPDGCDGSRTRFLAVEVASGDVLRDEIVDLPSGCGLCVANPVARSRDGRWVAFEWDEGSVIFVDATLHRPVHHSPARGYFMAGAAVAASPTDPAAFWILSADGLLRKLRVVP